MNIYDILRNKRKGKSLDSKEIEFIVKGYYYDEVPSYQMAAFLTSIAINGMNEEETFAFTKAMIETGTIMDFSNIDGIKVDKHSTGGVGDTVSLIVIPILACLGCKVPKLSGRALGHTGGTIDKLESIPGFQTNLDLNFMEKSLHKVGAFISLPLDLAPADKKIYSLRDVTANVDSIPLIASSIMSKKIAANSDVIILDVKVGNGAFMNHYTEALELARTMISIAKKFNKICSTIITDMNEPLNNYVGNYLEIISAIDFLKGNYDKYPRLKEVCFSIVSTAKFILDNLPKLKSQETEVISLKSDNFSYDILEDLIDNGSPLIKLREIIENQGGDSSIIEDPYKYFYPKVEYTLYSSYEGYIYFDTYYVGLAAGQLGLSRKTLEDKIDNNAGMIFQVQAGDYVKSGQAIVKLYTQNRQLLESSLEILEKSIKFSNQSVKNKTVYEILV